MNICGHWYAPHASAHRLGPFFVGLIPALTVDERATTEITLGLALDWRPWKRTVGGSYLALILSLEHQ
jgi:hypothetical protein